MDLLVIILAALLLIGSISIAIPSKLSREISKIRMEAKLIGCKITSNLYGENQFKNHSKYSVSYRIKNKTNLKYFGTRLYYQTKNNTVILLGSISNKKPTIFCAVSLDCVDKINASDLVKDISKIIQGGGGGSPTIATAG